MPDNTANDNQKIVYEHTVMRSIPQEVMKFSFVIKNPDPVTQMMERKITQQAGELMCLKGFVKNYAFIFNPTMKGGVITGVCPFSLN